MSDAIVNAINQVYDLIELAKGQSGEERAATCRLVSDLCYKAMELPGLDEIAVAFFEQKCAECEAGSAVTG